MIETSNINNNSLDTFLSRKNYKESLPFVLPLELYEVCVGVLLGDATMYRQKNGASIKFEQLNIKNIFCIFLINLNHGLLKKLPMKD